MIYRLAADLTLIAHLLFIVFVLFGGLLVLRWPRAAWVHLPCALYGILIEWVGWICPLTPLENALRRMAGQDGYAGGFVENYILPIIYPSGLTEGVQLVLGLVVLVFNAIIYGVSFAARKKRHAQRHAE